MAGVAGVARGARATARGESGPDAARACSGASTDVGGACVIEIGVKNGPGSSPSVARSHCTSRGGVPTEERQQ